jgi:hypothetical protein
MSVKGHTFKEISSYLIQELQFHDGRLPSLQWVDRDKGQFEQMDRELPIPFPAILLSFGRAEYETVGKSTQEGSGILRIRVGYESYAESFDGSIDQEQALKFWEFMEEVHKKLQGLSGTYFSSLERIAEEEDLDHDMIIVNIMEYRCKIFDSSADKTKRYVLATAEPVITKGKRPEPPPVVHKFVIP